MNKDNPPKEIYLGDGLYVSYDGEYVRLRAPHVFGKEDQIVYLDRDVFVALVKYASTLRAFLK